MATLEIAIDPGSSNTSVFVSGNGIISHAPTMAAYLGSGKTRTLSDIGHRVKAMVGKAAGKTTIVEPVTEGILTDPTVAIDYFRQTLKQIRDSYTFFPPRLRAVVTIPCGLTMAERSTVEDVFLAAGTSDVLLLDSIIASAAGCGIPIDTAESGFVVNIGGGKTDIGIISMCGIVTGRTMGFGGRRMDEGICEHIEKRYNISIATHTAEKLKCEIGSLHRNDGAEMQVCGLDNETKRPMSVVVTARDVFESVLPYYNMIADAITAILHKAPLEISSQIQRRGIVLTGGGAEILGLEQLFLSRLSLPITISRDPKYTCVLGAGKLLNDKPLLSKVRSQN
jgi:rod shape-determining protein MreB